MVFAAHLKKKVRRLWTPLGVETSWLWLQLDQREAAGSLQKKVKRHRINDHPGIGRGQSIGRSDLDLRLQITPFSQRYAAFTAHHHMIQYLGTDHVEGIL